MREFASIIFLNRKRQILLQLRDDEPTLPYFNMWVLPGGAVEDGETAAECIQREMQEEMDIALVRFLPYIILVKETTVEHVFWTKANFKPSDVVLTEGQRIAWFNEDQSLALSLGFEGDVIVRSFWQFQKKQHLPNPRFLSKTVIIGKPA